MINIIKSCDFYFIKSNVKHFWQVLKKIISWNATIKHILLLSLSFSEYPKFNIYGLIEYIWNFDEKLHE